MLIGPELGGGGTATHHGGPEETAARLLRRGDEELARTLVSASCHVEDKSSVLWLLVRGFHLLTHKRQCELVTRTVRGFVTLPAEEQVAPISSLVLRIRIARLGWRKAARKRQNDDPHLCLVGVQGRAEADPGVVEFLDSVETCLRRLDQEKRARIHRRLDKAFSDGFTPAVMATLLSALPPNDARKLEMWVVEEGALPEDSARRLFSALERAAAASEAASSAASSVRASLADGSEALWAALAAELSQDSAVDRFWPEWLEGRPPSPEGSVCGSPRGGYPGHESGSRTGKPSLGTVLEAPRRTVKSRDTVQRQTLCSSAAFFEAEPTSPSKGREVSKPRSSVKLHCAPEMFLLMKAPSTAPSGGAGGKADLSLGEAFGF